MDQKKPANAPAQKAAPVTGIASVRAVAEKDYHFLRKALTALGASLLLVATLVGVSRYIMLKLHDTAKQLQSQQEEVKGRYTQAETEKVEIRDFQPKFIQLRERGFVGDEKRLEWIETIKQIHESRKLLPLTYEISAQLPFQIDPSVMPADMELRGSKIKLHMDLLHEMDLFNFMEDLKRKATYTTQSCTIVRAKQVQLEDALSPALTADCTLYWLSIAERLQNADEAAKTAGK